MKSHSACIASSWLCVAASISGVGAGAQPTPVDSARQESTAKIIIPS